MTVSAVRTRRAPRPLARGLAQAVVVTLVALAPSPAASGPAWWAHAPLGSWMIIEAWKHGIGEPRVARVTTRLVRRADDRPWFEHIDGAGRRWEDADPGTGEGVVALARPAGRDLPLAMQDVPLNGALVRCRVILNEVRSEDWATPPAVSHWIARTKRWEAIDSTFRVRVLKRVDLGLETHYRDGRVTRAPGRSTEMVKTLHETVRSRGRAYDCWVSVTKAFAEDGSFAGRTTLWRTDEAPTGWVRRLVETRAGQAGGVSRVQQELVGFGTR